MLRKVVVCLMMGGGFGLVLNSGITLGLFAQLVAIGLEVAKVGLTPDIISSKWLIINIVLLFFLAKDYLHKEKP